MTDPTMQGMTAEDVAGFAIQSDALSLRVCATYAALERMTAEWDDYQRLWKQSEDRAEYLNTMVNDLTAELAALRADSNRWRYVRDKIEVDKQRTLAGTVRPCIATRIGHSTLPDGTPTKWDRVSIEDSIDTAMEADK